MLHKLYQKQVEAWKEMAEETVISFKKDFETGRDIEPPMYLSDIWADAYRKLLSSRHKDTIELLEAIIKEVEGMKIRPIKGGIIGPQTFERGMSLGRENGYKEALSDLKATLQAELTLLKNER